MGWEKIVVKLEFAVLVLSQYKVDAGALNMFMQAWLFVGSTSSFVFFVPLLDFIRSTCFMVR